ncbi:MAG: hypothetical protein HZA53_19245 [Planctomycetes bacterium]|nr:hypothetical protein [Planctomycetota bacterium]
MSACPHCQAAIETPLACAACGTVLDPIGDTTPYELLGLPLAWSIDPSELKKRLARYGRLVHPDFFAQAPDEERERAEQASARLNAAHALLADDTARADWLVEHLGGPRSENERELPRAFLLEVLDWNEELEALSAGSNAPGAASRLDALARSLEARRDEGSAAVARLLTPLPSRGSPGLVRVRQELNVLSYLERALGEIEALRSGNVARR